MKFDIGLNTDVRTSKLPSGTWVDARNIVIDNGQESVYSEAGFDLSGYKPSFPYPICGFIGCDTGVIIFSRPLLTISKHFLIEYFEPKTGFQKTILHTQYIDYDPKNIIEGVFKRNYNGDLIIIWWNGVNDTSNDICILNCDDLPFPINSLYEIDTTIAGITSEHIQLLKLFPNTTNLNVDISTGSGSLPIGAYCFTSTYVYDDGNYLNFSVPTSWIPIGIPVGSTGLTGRSGTDWYVDGTGGNSNQKITLNLSNVDTKFNYLKLGVIKNISGAISFEEVGDFRITGDTLSINYNGERNSNSIISLSEVLTDNFIFNKVQGGAILENSLYVANLTTDKEINLQKYINNVKLEYATETITVLDGSSDGFKNSSSCFHFKGMIPEEVYAMFLRVVFKKQNRSKWYHIPGRDWTNYRGHVLTQTSPGVFAYTDVRDSLSDLGIYQAGGAYSTGINGKIFQLLDTSKINTGAEADDGGMFGYWENENELYPTNEDSEIWDSTGRIGYLYEDSFGNSIPNVRHHKAPRGTQSDTITDETNYLYVKNELGGFDNGYNTPTPSEQISERCIGIYLKDVYFPPEIADEIQGFELGFAKRKWEDTTVLGFSPAVNRNYQVGDGSVCIGQNSIPNGVLFSTDPREMGILDTQGGMSGNVSFNVDDTDIDSIASSITAQCLGFGVLVEAYVDHGDKISLRYTGSFSGFKISPATTPGYANLTDTFGWGDAADRTGDMDFLISQSSNQYMFMDYNLCADQPIISPSFVKIVDVYDYANLSVIAPATTARHGAITSYGYIQHDDPTTKVAQLILNGISVLSNDNIHSSLPLASIQYFGESIYPQWINLISLNSLKPNVYLNYHNQEIVSLGHMITYDSTATKYTTFDNNKRILGFDSYCCYYNSQFHSNVNPTIPPYGIGSYIVQRVFLQMRYCSPTNLYFKYKPSIGFYSVDGYPNPYVDGNYYINRLEDFSKLQVYKNTLVYDSSVHNVYKFPYIIYHSLPFTNELVDETFRKFPVGNFYNMPNDKGIIFGLRSKSKTLFIQHSNSLFVASAKDVLSTETTGDTFISSGGIFDRIPMEIASDAFGTIGCSSKYAMHVFMGIYYVCDVEQGRIFSIDEQLKITDMSSIGQLNFFLNNLPGLLHVDNPLFYTGVSMVYDFETNRFIVTKRNFELPTEYTFIGTITTTDIPNTNIDDVYFLDYDSGTSLSGVHYGNVLNVTRANNQVSIFDKNLLTNTSFTYSFDLGNAKWTCYHDYYPNAYIRLKDSYLPIRNDNTCDPILSEDINTPIDTVPRLYNANSDTKLAIYFNDVPYPSHIDLLFNEEPNNHKTFETIMFSTDVVNSKGVFQYSKTINSILAYNDTQCSEVVNLDYVSDWYDKIKKDVYGTWHFNDFKDAVLDDSGTKAVFDAKKQPYDANNPNVILNPNLLNVSLQSKDWFDRSLFISKWLISRLIITNAINNNTQDTVYINDFNVKYRLNYR